MEKTEMIIAMLQGGPADGLKLRIPAYCDPFLVPFRTPYPSIVTPREGDFDALAHEYRKVKRIRRHVYLYVHDRIV